MLCSQLPIILLLPYTGFLMRLMRRIVQPLRYQYLEYRQTASGGVQTPSIAYMTELVKLLHPVDFETYRTEHGLAATVLVQQPNVGEMSTFLKRAADLLSAGEMVPIEDLQERATTVSLDQWLTVANGFYVNPVGGMTLFLEQTRRLLKVIAAHEHEKVGVYAASWRQMRNFYVSLQSLLVCLVHASHEALKG